MKKEKKPRVPYPYALKILEEKLQKEIDGLAVWNGRLSSSDPLLVRMANGNIPSNEERIKDLRLAIEFMLKDYM